MTVSQYNSPIGTITLVSGGISLTELRLAKHQEEQAFPYSANTPTPQIIADTIRWLDLYFSGARPDFTPPLKPKGSPFQQKIWHELTNIPYGQTTTYGAIAKRISCRSAQAVGQAIHRNPIAIIIPCHRVIGSDGSLTGYASGLDVKRQLLAIEGLF